MNLRDFYIVASKVLDLLTSTDPTPLYQNLIDYLNSIRNSPSPDLQTSINQTVELLEKQNRKVEEELNKIPHSAFMIERLNITNSVGSEATARLLEVLRTEAYIAPSSIQTLIQEIASIKTQLSTIIDQFNKFGIEYSFDNTESLLSIEYRGDSEVNSTKELKARLDDIEHITRAFARLSGNLEAFKDPSIISISKSSPLIIDIGNNLSQAVTYIAIGRAITWAMDRVEQQYRIRLTRAQLKKENLTNKQLEAGWEELEKHKTDDAEIKRFVTNLYKESQANQKTGDPESTKKDLLEAMKRILHMVEEGAQMNVYLPPGSESASDNEEEGASVTLTIAMSYKKLELQERQLLLEDAAAKKPETNAADYDKEATDKA